MNGSMYVAACWEVFCRGHQICTIDEDLRTVGLRTLGKTELTQGMHVEDVTVVGSLGWAVGRDVNSVQYVCVYCVQRLRWAPQ